jgi:quercetin dioxygenase-like cupin family protein
MSRLEQARLENQRVDRLTHHYLDPLPLQAKSPADLVGLRAAWSLRDSIPCLLPGRDAAADHCWPGMDVRTFLSGDSSSGRLSVHDIIVAPGGGLPAHYHDEGDVFLYVLEGELELTVGHLCEASRRGSFGYVPARTTTAWRNKTTAPAHLFVIYSPAGVDRAFAQAHQWWVNSGDSAPEGYLAILTRFGFRFDLTGALENDARTNWAPARLEVSVNSFEEFASMRKQWTARLPIPKLLHDVRECRKISLPDGINSCVLVSGDESSGCGVLFAGTLDPGYMAGGHYQPSEDELFFVLEGELELTCGSQTKLVNAGAFGFAPRGATHGFKGPLHSRTRIITFNSPAGHERGFEMIMEQMSKPEEAAGPTQEFIRRLSAHGWQLHGFPME